MREMADRRPPPTYSSEDPLRQLFDDHYAAMVRLAAALTGDPGRAEDVAQEAFIKLDGRVESVTPGARVAYLRAAVVSVARSEHRRSRRLKRRPRATRRSEPSVEDQAIASAERDRVLVALDALSDRQRECVVLHYYAGLSDREVGDAIGIATGSVKTHLDRARRALREQLGDDT